MFVFEILVIETRDILSSFCFGHQIGQSRRLRLGSCHGKVAPLITFSEVRCEKVTLAVPRSHRWHQCTSSFKYKGTQCSQQWAPASAVVLCVSWGRFGEKRSTEKRRWHQTHSVPCNRERLSPHSTFPPPLSSTISIQPHFRAVGSLFGGRSPMKYQYCKWNTAVMTQSLLSQTSWSQGEHILPKSLVRDAGWFSQYFWSYLYRTVQWLKIPTSYPVG